MPKFFDELGEASLENLASDPSNLPEGRVWKNSTSQLPKIAIGGAVKELITNDGTQTLSNKTISGASNTITNVSGSNVVNTPSGNLAATDVQAALNELQSDVDTRATSSSLTTHTGATTAHGVTGALVGTSDAQVLTAKDIDGGTASNTSRVTIPKDTLANLQALTRKEGTIVYATDTDKFYSDNGTNLVPVGSGSGAKNYFTDGDSEGANPFTLFNDGVGIWVDGTGGSPTATITQSSSSPLSGQKSFLFTSGTQYDTGKASVTIDREDKYKVITLEMAYEKASGTYTDGDLQLFVFDSTNSAILYASPISDVQASGVNAKQHFSFQATDSLTYQILIHQKTSATFTMKFEMKFGPQQFAGYAPITTDWKDFPSLAAGTLVTGTGTNPTYGTVITHIAQWKRDGSDMLVRWNYHHQGGAGSHGTGIYLFNIPSSIGSIDLTKSPANTQTTQAVYADMDSSVGSWAGASSSGYMHIGKAIVYSASQIKFHFAYTGAAQGALIWGDASATWGATEMSMVAEMRIPMLGWSSESKVISEYDGRVVAASAYISASYAPATNDYINFDTIIYDSHNGITTGTGTSWRYTAKVAGKYSIKLTGSSSSGGNARLFKNGAVFSYITQFTTGIDVGNIDINLAVGEYISIEVESSYTLRGYDFPSPNYIFTSIYISMLSGAQQILAGQKIVAKYKLGSNLAVAANDPIIFDTKLIDDTGAYNTTTGIWTAPASGRVRISFEGNASALTVVYYKKNGTTKHHIVSLTNVAYVSSGYTFEQVVAGDQITINSYDPVTFNAQMVGIDATTVVFEMV